MTAAVSGAANTPVAAPAASTSDSTSADGVALNQNFDQFLKLLTTQLQNQDPLSPMDSTQFTNQLVAFSGVEQQLKTNDSLGKLLTMQTLNMTALGVSFIGKDVQVAGDKFTTTTAGAPAALAYSLPAAASAGTISVQDANGNTVYTQASELGAGSHAFNWDGKDQDGNAAPAGTYTLVVGAQDADKNALNVTTYVPGHVSGLQTADDGTLLLNVGDQTVPMTDVRQISESSSGT